jgi:hypothetical protein
MAVEARAPCGDCNNNNNNHHHHHHHHNNHNKVILIVILIKIITDKNLTLTKRLIKIKYCTYIISVKFDTACSLQVEEILVCSWNRFLLMHRLDVSLSGRIGF